MMVQVVGQALKPPTPTRPLLKLRAFCFFLLNIHLDLRFQFRGKFGEIYLSKHWVTTNFVWLVSLRKSSPYNYYWFSCSATILSTEPIDCNMSNHS